MVHCSWLAVTLAVARWLTPRWWPTRTRHCDACGAPPGCGHTFDCDTRQP